MIVYRLSNIKYASTLSSSGAANRWNRLFKFVIHCSENISLCALELLAHTNGIRPAGEFKIMEIEISDQSDMKFVTLAQLPENWHQLQSYALTQQIGNEWYESKSTLLMRIPSAIIQTEFSYIINTHHPDFSRDVKLINTKDFFWDSRFPSN